MSTSSVGPSPGQPVVRDPLSATTGGVPGIRQSAGSGLVVVGALLSAGVLVGVVWALIAPKVTCVAVETDCRYSYEGGRFFIAEGMFGLLAVAAGLLAAVFARRMVRELGWPIVIALTVGGLLASVVAWRVGVWLGPDDPSGQVSAIGDVAELPLRLRSSGLLMTWSIASLIVALVITMLDDAPSHPGVAPEPPPDPAELAARIQNGDQSRSTR